MKTAKVSKVMSGKPFDGPRGTLYGWWVTMDNGDNISVNTQSADRQPWAEGDTATYEITKTHQGKNGPWHSAKKVNPNGGFSGGGSSAPKQGGSWTPAKEKSVMVQGLLKSIIESGSLVNEWETKLKTAIDIHDRVVGSPAPAEAPAPAAPKPVAVSNNDESDLPF